MAALSLRIREDLTQRRKRQRSTVVLLTWLNNFPGEDWQQRWLSSLSEDAGPRWWEPTGLTQVEAVMGLTTLVALRVVRPSYDWVAGRAIKSLFRWFQDFNDIEGFARLRAAADHRQVHRDALDMALHTLIKVMASTGRALEDISGDDILAYVGAMKSLGKPHNAHLTWQLLRDVGLLVEDAPTLQTALAVGASSVEELVDRYSLSCRAVRDVLVDYLKHRSAELDHGALRDNTYHLAKLFWADLERHHPGIDSLHLPSEVAEAWKQRVRTNRTTSGALRTLVMVRSFYLDIAEWALEDPLKWAAWAAPPPVASHDMRGHKKALRSTRARMQARTRTLAPVLPLFARSTHAWLKESEELLARSLSSAADEEFTVRARRYRRLGPKGRQNPRPLTDFPQVRVVELFGEQREFDARWVEDDAFWAWAIVEVLRMTGLRLEELLELTHLSLRQYVRRDGEVTPLLQVSPSKTDLERIIPMSPELVHVVARIVKRVRGAASSIPLVERYDHYERVHSVALPHLFQRRRGARNVVYAAATIQVLLRRAAHRAGLVDVDGSPIRFRPHDFRRLFATEIVNSGLPIHIGAKLLGHLDLNTTQGYVAIYPEEVIQEFQRYIERRRAERPGEEYREPTDAEWSDFEDHFLLRKVALGECGRPYGTPCIHEHSCVRCPFLRPDRDTYQRLVAIEQNVDERITEAQGQRWLGEVAALQETRVHITRKKEQALRLFDLDHEISLVSPTGA